MRLGEALRVISAVLSITLVGSVGDALACSCVQAESPCAALKRPGAVLFVGTALEVSAGTDESRGRSESVLRVRFSVNEAFGDASGSTLVVSTPDHGAACGYSFTAGESYLVHAYRTADGLRTSICSRTAMLSAARDDLELMREVGRGAVQSRLHGTVLLLMSRMNGTLAPAVAGTLPGVRVVASGGTVNHEVMSDDKGNFRFIGLAPGRYTVRADAKAPFQPMFDSAVTAEMDDCSAEAHLFLTAASLSGTIRRHDGSPAPRGVRVTVVEAGHVASSRSAMAVTDAEGRWTVDGLPDGKYLVGVNVFQAPSARSPFPTVWHAEPADSSKGREVLLRDQRPRHVDLTLPLPLPQRTIRGVVLDADGRTVRGANVSVVDGEFPGEDVATASTDADGRFAVDVVAGRRALARARLYTPAGPVESETFELSDSNADAPLTLMLWKTGGPR